MTEKELREEHLAKVAGGARALLNGLISYTYNDGVGEPGYEPFEFANIGDCIQSLAARQYFPSVERCIDRDQLGEYAGEPVNVIMNAWYRLWRKNMVFSPTKPSAPSPRRGPRQSGHLLPNQRPFPPIRRGPCASCCGL